MPHSYNVDIQAVEGNAVRISVTGTVNGRQVAATLLRGDIGMSEKAMDEALVKKAWPAKVRTQMGEALVDAFGGGPSPAPHPGMLVVTRE